MTNQKKLEVIEEAFNYYHDRTSLTRLEEKELTDFVNELKEAISVTRCSTQLKDKPKLTFEEWYRTYGYAKSVTGNFVKEGVRYTAEEMQFKYDYNMP